MVEALFSRVSGPSNYESRMMKPGMFSHEYRDPELCSGEFTVRSRKS